MLTLFRLRSLYPSVPVIKSIQEVMENFVILGHNQRIGENNSNLSFILMKTNEVEGRLHRGSNRLSQPAIRGSNLDSGVHFLEQEMPFYCC